MLNLYAQLLKKWISENQIEGIVFIWLREKFIDEFSASLKTYS